MELTPARIKKGIFMSITISILAILFVILMGKDGFSLNIFKQVKPFYLIVATLVTLTFWLIKSLKLNILASTLGKKISLHRVFSIYLASAFVAHVTPSTSGGLPFLIYFMHREGLALGKTTAITIMDSMLSLIFFLVVSPVLLIIWGSHLQVGPGITRLFYLAVVILIGFIIFSLFLIFNTEFANTFINWLTSRKFLHKLISDDKLENFKVKIKREINRFNDGMKVLLNDRINLIFIILYTLLYWGFYLSLAPILIKGLGLNIAVPPVILAQLIFNFIQPMIPTPGGSGGAELGFAYFFKYLMPDYFLGIFVAIWRFFMFYTSLIVGGIYFLFLVRGTDFFKNTKEKG